jgi:hypothetical protein
MLRNNVDAIQPHNRAALERLIQRITAKRLGCTFTVADWDEIHRILGRPWARWYRTLLQAYPLAGVPFYVPWKMETSRGATCMILPPDALKAYSAQDYFFVDAFYLQWLQFGEAFHFGGPGRWLIPSDESVAPIVHSFSDGDAGPISTNLLFDDFILAASLERPREKRVPGAARIKQQLEKILIPKALFEKATVTSAFENIRRLAKEHDPLKEGIEIELTPSVQKCPRLITFSVENETLRELVLIVACVADLECDLTAKGVQIRNTFE